MFLQCCLWARPFLGHLPRCKIAASPPSLPCVRFWRTSFVPLWGCHSFQERATSCIEKRLSIQYSMFIWPRADCCPRLPEWMQSVESIIDVPHESLCLKLQVLDGPVLGYGEALSLSLKRKNDFSSFCLSYCLPYWLTYFSRGWVSWSLSPFPANAGWGGPS